MLMTRKIFERNTFGLICCNISASVGMLLPGLRCTLLSSLQGDIEAKQAEICEGQLQAELIWVCIYPARMGAVNEFKTDATAKVRIAQI